MIYKNSFKISVILFLFIFFTYVKKSYSAPDFEIEQLQIYNGNKKFCFEVFIADTYDKRRHGLMFVKKLKENMGMLFVYPRSQIVKMWMKNTIISLDMIFIKKNGKIVYISPNTTPHDLTPLGPDTKVRGVLEIVGGLTEKLKINSSSTINHRVFNENKKIKCTLF